MTMYTRYLQYLLVLQFGRLPTDHCPASKVDRSATLVVQDEISITVQTNARLKMITDTQGQTNNKAKQQSTPKAHPKQSLS